MFHILVNHADNWYLGDSNLIFFQLKAHEMVIEIKMKMIPIISFSIHAIGVFIVSICKFIFTLNNLMAIISDINIWLWQWLKFMYHQHWSLNQGLCYCLFTANSLILVSCNRDSFWEFIWEKVKTQGVSNIGFFWWSQCEIRGFTSEILTVSDNRWSSGWAIFKGNPAIKTSKMRSPFHNNIVLEILDHWQTSNQFDMNYVSVGDISFSVVFTCRRSEICDPLEK